jgi:phosphoadenosine phosphosulfate reductase
VSLCAHVTQTDPSEYVARANRRLAGATAGEILGWAAAEFGDGLTVACSMQDAVVVHLAAAVAPGVEVVFLDTGFHFPETLATARAVAARYDVNLVTLRPAPGAADRYRATVEDCCAARKVEPLEQHLRQRSAWVTGLRRAESPSRAGAAAVEWDEARQMVKVNPIVAWSDEDVDRFVARHDVPVNPLRHRGYDSIGCAPCTATGSGRDGRWAGSDKLECGLHTRGRVTLAVTERS